MDRELEIGRRLDAIDWSFPSAQTSRRSVHALHWFPGNFIPQIPAHFIQVLSRPGDVVLDPFCGSGTTGAEAYRLGRRSWQSDVCRASIQVAVGKLAVLRLEGARRRLGRVFEELHFEGLARRRWSGNRELVAWMSSDTLEQLSFIWDVVNQIEDVTVRAILELVFSDVLFACASAGGTATRSGGVRRHHWGWIADNVRPSRPACHNAVRLFRERLGLAADIAEAEADERALEAGVVRESVADLSCGERTVDLVVTSPPYLGVIDYALANRMSYLWMDWDMESDQRLELGSRRARNHTEARGRYLRGLGTSVDRIYRAMKRGAHCAIVIGASRRHADVVLEAVDVFGKCMRRIWGPVERIVTRRRVAERRGREARELLCVFQKGE